MVLVAAGALTPLVYASAMLLVPATMASSTALCLATAPSPFTLVAVHEYLRRTRWFERVWLLITFGWIAADVAQQRAPAWTVAVAAAALAFVGVHVWLTGPLRRTIAPLVEAILLAGPVTTISPDGQFVARRRIPEDINVTGARSAAGVLAVLLLAGIGLFLSVAVIGDRASFGLAVLVGGCWLSLGVIAIDLVQDVWPGTASQARLAQSCRYYVLMFEQWKNLGVVAGFGIVLIGSPIAWATGLAGAPVLAFPLWISACLAFATFFNQVLHRNGRTQHRLPLPVWVNEYSATRSLWAYFFTVIHAVMAAALVAGLFALHPALAQG